MGHLRMELDYLSQYCVTHVHNVEKMLLLRYIQLFTVPKRTILHVQ